jgi:hypothetical protein
MNELLSPLADPNVCAQVQQLSTFNLAQYAGVAGAPIIEQAVQYFKEHFPAIAPTKLAPVYAVAFGIALNTGIATYLGNSLSDALVAGMFTGFLASGWHEICKK